MSLEHHPIRAVPGAETSAGLSARDPPEVSDYWQSLIDEKTAAQFLGLTARTMQKLRQTGDGPRYIVISTRCLRYRRIDCRTWAEARMRQSTSDPGQAA